MRNRVDGWSGSRWKSLVLVLPLGLACFTLGGCVADAPPQMVDATAGDRSATVTWLPPLGGSAPIVAYVVTPFVNNVAQTPTRFDSTATTQTVTGLSNGTDYTFTVAAVNALGNESASSDESNALMPGPQIAAGTSHSCAIVAGGAVDCWGSNSSGQLGVPLSTTMSTTPIAVSGLTAIAIAAGSEHTCVVMEDRTVTCWGNNSSGQLGNGTTTNSSTPVPVTGLTGVTGITAHSLQTCAVVTTGGVYCWGENARGQLGNGTTIDSSTPVAASNLTGAVAVATGDAHTCALKSNGTVSCWGHSIYGALGNGGSDSLTPIPVPNLTSVIELSASADATCALVVGGSGKCWGIGPLVFDGDGELIRIDWTSNPTAVSGLAGATAIAAGGVYTCATVNGGAATCWAFNSLGSQVFDNPGLTAITSMAVSRSTISGPWHECALTANGAGYCWGDNESGQLGDGTTTGSATPVAVIWP